tara:strand:+ start:80 stop:844 length:765 start_codon:yes stop_codon:yes gene_type:complete
MVKCYTKKRNDQSKYTTCIGFQGKKKKPAPAPKKKAKGVMTLQKKIKKTGKLKNKSTIRPLISKPKAKPKYGRISKKPKKKLFVPPPIKIKKFTRKTKKKPKSKTAKRKLTNAETMFGRGGMGRTDNAVFNRIASFVVSEAEGGRRRIDDKRAKSLEKSIKKGKPNAKQLKRRQLAINYRKYRTRINTFLSNANNVARPIATASRMKRTFIGKVREFVSLGGGGRGVMKAFTKDADEHIARLDIIINKRRPQGT